MNGLYWLKYFLCYNLQFVSYRNNAICPTWKDIYLTFFLLTLGPPLPKALEAPSVVEIQGDAFLFGGRDSTWNENSAIYQLTCSSGICSWSTLNQGLKVAREYTVAIPVPDYFCESKEGMLDHWLVKRNQKLLRLFMQYF